MKKEISAKDKNSESIETDDTANRLFDDIRPLIEETRRRVAQTVNSALVLMNWNIGKIINDEILKNERAEYGKEIVSSLSRLLVADYGRGFGRRNLFNIVRFAEVFSEFEIVQTLSAQLSWSHFIEIIKIEEIKTRLLRRNVPHRALECADFARQNSGNAF